MSERQQQNGNPLIGLTQGDTIAGIRRHLEFLCLVADDEELAHPGLALELRMVRDAVDSLKDES